MPISRRITLKCPKCGYKFSKTIGDVLSPMDIMPICPICQSPMKTISSKSVVEYLDDILSIFSNKGK